MYCTDVIKTSWLIFSADTPILLYYSHIPTAIVAVLLGLFVFLNNRKSITSKIFLVLNLSYGLLVFLNLVLWTNSYIPTLVLIWPITQILFIMIPVLALYFFYTFVNKKDAGMIYKITGSIIILIPILIAYSKLNIVSFDADLCELNVTNLLFTYQNIIFVIIFISLITLFIRKIIVKLLPKNERKELIFLFLGIFTFLISFIVAWQIAEAYDYFNVEQYGLFGMTILLAVISFIIVRFKAFNIKLLGSQALVWTLIILIGSEFFFVESTINKILIAITLVISAIVGLVIVRSVKKEIAQKEQIEKIAIELSKSNHKLNDLNQDLKVANDAQATTLRFITHQINGVFTSTKAGLARLTEGDLDPISEPVKDLANRLYKIQVGGVESVQVFLTVSQFETGKNPCIMKPINIKEMISEVSSQLKIKAEIEKHLTYEINLPSDEDYTIMADKTYLSNSLFNLIDNAIRYTATGSIKIGLAKIDGDSILFSVKDTGQGISEEDQKIMFTKYGHGKKSREVNVNSNGLGLYLVKLVVEAHKGKVWFETTIDKGTTFYVKLPLPAKLPA